MEGLTFKITKEELDAKLGENYGTALLAGAAYIDFSNNGSHLSDFGFNKSTWPTLEMSRKIVEAVKEFKVGSLVPFMVYRKLSAEEKKAYMPKLDGEYAAADELVALGVIDSYWPHSSEYPADIWTKKAKKNPVLFVQNFNKAESKAYCWGIEAYCVVFDDDSVAFYMKGGSIKHMDSYWNKQRVMEQVKCKYWAVVTPPVSEVPKPAKAATYQTYDEAVADIHGPVYKTDKHPVAFYKHNNPNFWISAAYCVLNSDGSTEEWQKDGTIVDWGLSINQLKKLVAKGEFIPVNGPYQAGVLWCKTAQFNDGCFSWDEVKAVYAPKSKLPVTQYIVLYNDGSITKCKWNGVTEALVGEKAQYIIDHKIPQYIEIPRPF